RRLPHLPFLRTPLRATCRRNRSGRTGITAVRDLRRSKFLARNGSRGTMFNRKRLFTLRPYGDALCSPAARLWMACSATAVFLMATAEASAWSYVGFFLGTGVWRYPGAILLGAIVFLLVWILDSTLLTIDVMRAERQAQNASVHKPASGAMSLFRSGGVGLAVRIAMVIGSLFVSAPYLTQLVFSQDVTTVLARRDNEKRAVVRARLAQNLTASINDETKSAAELQRDLVNEAAGKGPSGRIGRGPTVA